MFLRVDSQLDVSVGVESLIEEAKMESAGRDHVEDSVDHVKPSSENDLVHGFCLAALQVLLESEYKYDFKLVKLELNVLVIHVLDCAVEDDLRPLFSILFSLNTLGKPGLLGVQGAEDLRIDLLIINRWGSLGGQVTLEEAAIGHGELVKNP